MVRRILQISLELVKALMRLKLSAGGAIEQQVNLTKQLAKQLDVVKPIGFLKFHN